MVMLKEELEEEREKKAWFPIPPQFSHLDVLLYNYGLPEKPPFLNPGPIKTSVQQSLASLLDEAIKTPRWTCGTAAW